MILNSMTQPTASSQAFQKQPPEKYDLRPVHGARVAGRVLKTLAIAIRIPLIRGLIGRFVLWQLGVYRFRKSRPSGEALMHPVHPNFRQQSKKEALKSIQEFFDSVKNKHSASSKIIRPKKQKSTKSQVRKSIEREGVETVFDFHQAFLEGITTPSQVAQRFLDVVRSMEESAVPLKPMVEWDSKEILKQAEISTKRFEKGKPLGILDGVPVAVKDEIDLLPYKTMAGTRFYTKTTPLQDSTAVSRLRRAGALSLIHI